jgi:hypothetical protein
MLCCSIRKHKPWFYLFFFFLPWSALQMNESMISCQMMRNNRSRCLVLRCTISGHDIITSFGKVGGLCLYACYSRSTTRSSMKRIGLSMRVVGCPWWLYARSMFDRTQVKSSLSASVGLSIYTVEWGNDFSIPFQYYRFDMFPIKNSHNYISKHPWNVPGQLYNQNENSQCQLNNTVLIYHLSKQGLLMACSCI